MTGAGLAQRLPLDRAVQSWVARVEAASGERVAGVAGLLQAWRKPNGEVAAAAAGLGRGELGASGEALGEEPADWEALLRKQNSANDELCGENGRLRAELEKLRARQAAEEAPADGGGPADAGVVSHEDTAASLTLEEELLQTVHAAVQEVIREPRWRESRGNRATEPRDLSSSSVQLVEGEEKGPSPERQSREQQDEDDGNASSADEELAEIVRKEPPDEEEEEEAEEAPQEQDEEARCPGELGDAGKWLSTSGGPLYSQAVEQALLSALQEESEISTPMPVLTPAEETAVLVAERVALRELVERQQDQLETLEKELHAAGAQLPLGGAFGGALSGALSTALSNAQRFSDASDAFSAGLSAVLSAPKATAKGGGGAAEVGAQYEVIGRKGAIVRAEESLRSEAVGELPPGSLVRVVALSEKYPRRIEVVSVSIAPGSSPVSHHAGAGDFPPRPEDEAATALAASADPACDAGAAPAAKPVIGWISASTKDGVMLIRAVAAPEDAASQSAAAVGGAGTSSFAIGANASAGGADAEKEEGVVEVAHVTLSAREWDCLHSDQEATSQTLQALRTRLNQIGSELLQSFEMRSVLGELRQVLDRAEERRERMRETAAMANAEQLAWYATRRAWRSPPQQASSSSSAPVGGRAESSLLPARTELQLPLRGREAKEDKGEGAEEERQQPTPPKAKTAPSPASSGVAAAASASGPGVSPADWERVLSERETTAAALSAALQRVASLVHEAEELRLDQRAAEDRSHGEFKSLRTALRRLASGSVPTRRNLKKQPLAAATAAAEVAAVGSPGSVAFVTGTVAAFSTLAGKRSSPSSESRASITAASLKGELPAASLAAAPGGAGPAGAAGPHAAFGAAIPPAATGSSSAGIAAEGVALRGGIGGVAGAHGEEEDEELLFRRRLQDLQSSVAELRQELRRASSSEAALKSSLEARSNALRELLHRGAIAGLSGVQCGPVKLRVSVEAEIQALRIAVEEQLRWNLQLRRGTSSQSLPPPGGSSPCSPEFAVP